MIEKPKLNKLKDENRLRYLENYTKLLEGDNSFLDRQIKLFEKQYNSCKKRSHELLEKVSKLELELHQAYKFQKIYMENEPSTQQQVKQIKKIIEENKNKKPDIFTDELKKELIDRLTEHLTQ